MADLNKHIVNRVDATVSCDKRDLSKIQRLGLASLLIDCFEDLLSVLDHRFGHKHIYLDTLTIALDVRNDQLSDLSSLLATALSEALADIEKTDPAIAKSSYKEAQALSPEEVFPYFLQHGHMPWFSSTLDFEKIDLSNPEFKTQLKRILNVSTRARERLVVQFSASQLQAVLKKLYSASFLRKLFGFIQFISKNIGNHSERFASGFRLRQFLVISGVHYLAGAERKADFDYFLKRYWAELVMEVQKECNGQHLEFLQVVQALLKKQFKITSVLPLPSDNAGLPDNDINVPKSDGNPQDSQELANDIWKDTGKENQQMVLNAGTVLLHPFIMRFFNKVGLLENNQFISLAHQQRGICLLHNMATGDLVFPEEKLTFFKFLCHYPLNKAVPKEMPISEFELGEVEQVLRSAIEHWTALKQTSIEGLRVNFLQRKGLLEKDALGHTLHVESHTADILIDQLPWGLSAVRWPWLPELLTIKWR